MKRDLTAKQTLRLLRGHFGRGRYCSVTQMETSDEQVDTKNCYVEGLKFCGNFATFREALDATKQEVLNEVCRNCTRRSTD